VNRDVIYCKVLERAVDGVLSGFDAYFIALVLITSSIVISP